MNFYMKVLYLSKKCILPGETKWLVIYMKYGKQMYELIKILFWDQKYTHAYIYHMDDDGRGEISIRRDIVCTQHNEKQNGNILLCIENNSNQSCFEQIESILKDLNSKRIVGYYFCIKEKQQAVQLSLKSQEYFHRTGEIYGIDPDYFFSAIPFSSRSTRKKIERYILHLKVAISFRDKLKQLIKEILIFSALSDVLYEKFIVVVKPGDEF